MIKIPIQERFKIHVIGAGGTGGYAIEHLARLFSGEDTHIHVYDGDDLETKNLRRQNFFFDELDMNKAQALTQRLSENIYQSPAFTAHDEYITSEDEFMIELLSDFDPSSETLFIVMAVDNVATRRLINTVVMEHLAEAGIPVLVLDSGNDDQGGQVVLYANAPLTYADPLSTESSGMLPTMLQLYPEIDKIVDVNPGLEMNCADNAESQPQAMMANVRNGDLLANIVYQVYSTGAIPYNSWRSDILTGNTTSEFTGFHTKGGEDIE